MKSLLAALLLTIVVAIPVQAQEWDTNPICHIETGFGQSPELGVIMVKALVTSFSTIGLPEWDDWEYKIWVMYPRCDTELTKIMIGFSDENKKINEWPFPEFESVISARIHDDADVEEVGQLLVKPLERLVRAIHRAYEDHTSTN